MGAEDEQPEQPETLTINLQKSANETIAFKCKKSAKFFKILKSYAEKHGQDPSAYRLIFDGENVTGGDTPESLDLVDGDIVEVHLMQTGGGDDDDEGELAEKEDPAQISIMVQSQAKEETAFKVKRSIKFLKVFKAYANQAGVEVDSLKFTYDGTGINNDDTPESLEMEDEDIVQVHQAQVGGYGG